MSTDYLTINGTQVNLSTSLCARTMHPLHPRGRSRVDFLALGKLTRFPTRG